MFKLKVYNKTGHSCTYNTYKTYKEAEEVAKTLLFFRYTIEEVTTNA